jgi:predicted phosphodiesterase
MKQNKWSDDLINLLKANYPSLGGKAYDKFSEFRDRGISFEAFQKKAERVRVRYNPVVPIKEANINIAGETNKIFHLTTTEDKIRIIPFGDIHVGAPENLCDWKKVVGTLKYIEDTPNTYMIGMGDYGDFAMKMSHGPSIYEATLNPQQQYEAILNAFKPIAKKGKILGMISGNHDDWIKDFAGLDIVRNLSRELNTAYLASGATVYIYVNDKRYVLNVRHGVGSAKEPHTKLASIYRQTRNLFADIFLMGHTHSLQVSKSTYVYEGITKKTYRILTGAFLNWNQSYAMEFGLTPEPTGVAKISLFDRKNTPYSSDIHVSL